MTHSRHAPPLDYTSGARFPPARRRPAKDGWPEHSLPLATPPTAGDLTAVGHCRRLADDSPPDGQKVRNSVTPIATGPLSGLLVADFSRVLAGPYATMLLADMGADVVKVESPGGDDTRTWVPPVRDGISTY